MAQYNNTDFIFAKDIQSISEAHRKFGVLDGCQITAGTGLSITITTGNVLFTNDVVNVVGQNNIQLNPTNTNARKDTISINPSGNIIITQGTEALVSPEGNSNSQTRSPVAPNTPTGNILLGEVFIPANANTILSSNIRDLRQFVVEGGIGDMIKSVYDTNDNGIVDNAQQLNDETNVVTAQEVREHIDDDTIHFTQGEIEIQESQITDLQNYVLVDNLATQQEAETGTDNTKWMTPLRTKQAIDEFAGATGESNTASNIGSGEGVFSAKVGVDLEFKTLIGGTNVTLSSTADEITINATGAGGASELGELDDVDITGLANHHTIRYNSTSGNWEVGFIGTNNIQDNAITTAKILNDNVTFAKIQNITQNNVLGRTSSGSGDIQTINANNDGVLRRAGSGTLGFGTLVTGNIGDNQITDSKIATGVNATKIANGSVTNTEFQYLDGVTSPIQTQLNARAIDTEVVKLTGNQTIEGVKTFDDNLVFTTATSGDVDLGNLGSTQNIDWSLGSDFFGVLNSNVIITFSNDLSGQKIDLFLNYDNSAQRDLTMPSGILWSGGNAPLTPDTAGQVLVITLKKRGSSIFGTWDLFEEE